MRVTVIFLLILLSGCGSKTALEVQDAAPFVPECAIDSDCDDGRYCTGVEACREGRCMRGAPVVCMDGDRCTNDRCDESTRACVFAPATNDDDGDGFRAALPFTTPGSPAACGNDCDDRDRSIHPGATEFCNAKDDDCNGVIDDDATFAPADTDIALSEASLAPSGVGGLQWSGERYLGTFWGYDMSSAHVYFTPRNRDGAPLSTPASRRLTLTPSDAYGAVSVWSGTQLGIAWQDRRDGNYEVYFNRLTAEGDKLGPDQRLSFAAGFSLNPSIAWTGEEFVVAWQDERDTPAMGFDIYLQRIDANGRQIEDNVRLTTNAGASESPVIAFSTSSFGVAWIDDRRTLGGTGERSVWFAPITRDLRRLSPDLRLSPLGQQSVSPSIVYNGDRFVVAWHDASERSTDHEVWGATIAASGSVIDAARRLTNDAGFSRYPSLVALGDRVLLAWADDRAGDGYDVYARMLGRDLAPQSAEVRVTRAPRDSVYPIATLGPDGDVAVLFRDQREGRWQVRMTQLRCAISR